MREVLKAMHDLLHPLFSSSEPVAASSWPFIYLNPFYTHFFLKYAFHQLIKSNNIICNGAWNI